MGYFELKSIEKIRRMGYLPSLVLLDHGEDTSLGSGDKLALRIYEQSLVLRIYEQSLLTALCLPRVCSHILLLAIFRASKSKVPSLALLTSVYCSCLPRAQTPHM